MKSELGRFISTAGLAIGMALGVRGESNSAKTSVPNGDTGNRLMLNSPLPGFCSGCEGNETGDPRTESTPVHKGESFLVSGRDGNNHLIFVVGPDTEAAGDRNILVRSRYGYIETYRNSTGDMVTHYCLYSAGC